MPAAAIATIALAGVLVAALALYLTWVVLLLRRIEDTLGKVTFGVRAVAHRTRDINPTMDDLNTNLSAVADAVDGIVEKATTRSPAA